MFSSGGALLWRRGVSLLMLTKKGWVDGNGLNPGGGFGKPGGGRETRGGGDGLEAVANYPWFEHRDHLVTFEVEEVLEPNTGKQEKERQTCRDYLKYEESHVRIKCESISKKKKSNYPSFQDLRSSCNEDMVKYEGPRPSITRERVINEKSNKKIPPATSQPLGWRVCRPALGAYVFHFILEET
ncbi:hypothetical protein Tco_0924852 [Tanacetum coccineum]|uniref:Uncharacterized protein n=1 Tax=Tanacetum coccineum TaxID=301880 RepID=A0ABQ5D5Z8_9ASTR